MNVFPWSSAIAFASPHKPTSATAINEAAKSQSRDEEYHTFSRNGAMNIPA
jgi:hypothetical protein